MYPYYRIFPILLLVGAFLFAFMFTFIHREFLILNIVQNRIHLFQRRFENNSEVNANVYKHYAKDNLLILSTTDYHYLDLALNLHKTIEKYNITNYLFGCTELEACQELKRRNIHFFNMGSSAQGREHSKFRSPSYNNKTYYKTELVLNALYSGVSAFFVDSDCVFLKNPLHYIQGYNQHDIMITMELNQTVYNSGIYIANPTPATIKLHETMIKQQIQNKGSNQVIMNRVIPNLKKDGLKVVPLGEDIFLDGRGYIYNFKHSACCSFAWDDCCPRSKTVIFHNNIAFSLWVKIYRFKEQLTWYLDTDRYYSSTKRKYLKMSFQGSCLCKDQQAVALMNGLHLASALKRTLILPKFMCPNNKTCSFLDLFGSCIQILDESDEFTYREHMFLENPMVPPEVQESVTRQLDFPSQLNEQKSKSFSLIKHSLGPYKDFSVLQVTVPHNQLWKLDDNAFNSWEGLNRLNPLLCNAVELPYSMEGVPCNTCASARTKEP